MKMNFKKMLGVGALALLACGSLSFGVLSASANEGKTAKIATLDGASIRYQVAGEEESLSGIRFSGYVLEDYKTNNPTAEVGMLVIPEKLLTGALTAETAKVQIAPAVHYVAADGELDDREGYDRFNTVLYAIPASDYGTNIAARAYIKNGTEYVYAEETVVRSIGQVASLALSKNEGVEAELLAYVDNALTGVEVAETVTLSLQETKSLGAIVTPANLTAVYASDNTDVVTVDAQGNLHGVSVGSATVSVTVGSTVKTVNVTVTKVQPNAEGKLIVDDFEGYTDVAQLADKWTYTNNFVPTLQTEGGKSVSFAANGVGSLELKSAALTNLDLTNATGFAMKLKINESVKELSIAIGSYGNVYEYKREIYGATNHVDSIVCDFASMTLREGNYGELNKANINFVQIYVTCYSTYTISLDDVHFYTHSTPVTKGLDDFEGYADDAAVQSAWHNENLTLSQTDGNKAMTLNAVSGWNGLQYNFARTGEIGGELDYQNCYAIRFTVTASASASLLVKFTVWTNVEQTIAIDAGTTTVTAYFSKMSGDALSDLCLLYLTLGITQYNETATFTFDNIEFLRG